MSTRTTWQQRRFARQVEWCARISGHGFVGGFVLGIAFLVLDGIGLAPLEIGLLGMKFAEAIAFVSLVLSVLFEVAGRVDRGWRRLRARGSGVAA